MSASETELPEPRAGFGLVEVNAHVLANMRVEVVSYGSGFNGIRFGSRGNQTSLELHGETRHLESLLRRAYEALSGECCLACNGKEVPD